MTDELKKDENQSAADDSKDLDAGIIKDDGLPGELDDENTLEGKYPAHDATGGGKQSDNATGGGKQSDDIINKKPTQEEKLNYALKKRAFKLQEEKRKTQELEQRLQDTTTELNKLKQPSRPEVPAMPEPYDYDYDAKNKLRDEAIAARTRYDSNIETQKEQVLIAQEQAVLTHKSVLKTLTDGYNGTITDLGLDKVEMDKVESTIMPFLSEAHGPLIKHIMEHKQGPLIVKHLGDNFNDLETVLAMESTDAAVFIATNISPKLGNQKTEKSSTPAPAQMFSGGGSGKSKHPALEGVTYE